MAPLLKIYNPLLKRKKNILYYEPSLGFGGSTSALASIVNNLNRGFFYPIVIVKNFGSQMQKIKDTEIIKLRNYKEKSKLSNSEYLYYFIKNIIPEVIKLYFIIRRKRISLVHVNTNINMGIPVILAAKLARIPCVCHIRETRKLIQKEKALTKLVNKFIVLNNNALELYKYDISEDKLSIIYDGIDLEEFNNTSTSEFRKEYNLNSNPLIGVVGRIVKGKGQKEFILSAKGVLKFYPHAKFLIVGEAKGGDDSYYKEIQSLVNQENLDKCIIFTGWRNDIKNIISAIDVFVFTSTTYPEGLPNAIIEAMALKKPVVSTNVPGPRDIVIDKETGFLVPTGDIEAMSDRINHLLGDREIYQKMAEAGRKRVEELFDIKKNVRKIEDLYKRVLS